METTAQTFREPPAVEETLVRDDAAAVGVTSLDLIGRLTRIGAALSAEKDSGRLMELILDSAREFTGADGGTLYTRTDDDRLAFEIMFNESLNIHLGGTSGKPVELPPLNLYHADGSANRDMVAAWTAVSGDTVSIADAYDTQDFDFSGTRTFDEKTGYRSKSFLTVPMRNHTDEVIGVLQLINARERTGDGFGELRPFSLGDQQLVESLTSQAAIALTNKRLIEEQKQLFESFIELIAAAIDDKSPYTGGHCRRVPVLTMALADAAAATSDGPLADFAMSEEDRYELRIAGWLHDCGKVTTPEYVVDKATKLETIHDRINVVDARFDVLRQAARADHAERCIAAIDAGDAASVREQSEAEYRAVMTRLDDEQAFLRTANVGGEFMSEEHQARVREIGSQTVPGADPQPLLTEDEIENLNIERGTLTQAERGIINYHIVATIKMLESLPYPKHLARVPEFAGGHHERMDGKGYPRGLTRDQMSIQARVMGIADIFEALTAADRPYKKAMKLSQALTILGRMKEDNHVDPDLFDVFIRSKVYLDYANTHLDPAQVDEVDESKIPGYVA
ncbi:MAG: HD domain-containing phosphohydrolase [Pseudomonadota bacterium]